MQFCLVHPAFGGFTGGTQPPMGLAYLASVLTNKGAVVSIIDASAENLSNAETARRILARNPDVLGVTFTTPLVPNAIEIIRLVKNEKDIPVVVGGAHPTILPGETLAASPDGTIVVRGEGEITVQELYDYYQGKGDLSSIRGISYRSNGTVTHNPDRELVKDLDTLPLPSWESFPLRLYRSPVRKSRYTLPISTSRGCPFSCIYCWQGALRNTYRVRSAESVLLEWEYLVKKLGVEEIGVIDDNFTDHRKRVLDICNQIIKRRLVVPWTTPNGIRAHPIDREVLSAMSKAGCYRVWFGVESGDSEILKSIGKGATLHHYGEAVRLAREVGLEVGAFFMIGNLGETEETMDRTIQFAKKLDPDYANFNIATPYPGTKMYDLIMREGVLLVKRWDEFSSYGTAIFRHGALTPELVNRKCKQAIRSFYLRPRFVLRHIARLRTKRQLVGLLWAVKQVLQFAFARR